MIAASGAAVSPLNSALAPKVGAAATVDAAAETAVPPPKRARKGAAPFKVGLTPDFYNAEVCFPCGFRVVTDSGCDPPPTHTHTHAHSLFFGAARCGWQFHAAGGVLCSALRACHVVQSSNKVCHLSPSLPSLEQGNPLYADFGLSAATSTSFRPFLTQYLALHHPTRAFGFALL